MCFSENIKYHMNSTCSMLILDMFVDYLKSVLLWTSTYQNIKLNIWIVLLVDQVPESDLVASDTFRYSLRYAGRFGLSCTLGSNKFYC